MEFSYEKQISSQLLFKSFCCEIHEFIAKMHFQHKCVQSKFPTNVVTQLQIKALISNKFISNIYVCTSLIFLILLRSFYLI